MGKRSKVDDNGVLCRRVLLLTAVFSAASLASLDAQERSLDDVSFLAGCWAGTMGSLDMREQWSEAEGGVMLGTTRYFRDGRLADFEFAMMVEDDSGVTLWPYPRGERSERGFPLVRTDGEFVFENLEHDFPVRIIYVRDGETRLTPRIEGSDGEGPGWRLERVACPTG
ncbi:MAG: DUF6265 family protein [Gemmatimonadota bacterium]